MASSVISNSPSTGGDRSRDPHRSTMKKKKKPRLQQSQQDQSSPQNPAKWRSQAQQQNYSSNLRQALVRVNGSGGCGRGKAVRDAADRVLAVAARGRTRWSRAILMTNRLKLKFRKQQNRKKLLQKRVAGPGRSKKVRFSVFRLKGKTLPAVQRKVRFLGRLVPGCRKEPLPVILEEAIDYIPALEMQVRAMAALADLLLGSSSNSSAADGGSSSGFPPPS